MASTVTTVTSCETCQGAGTVAVTRSRWIGGGKEGYCSERTEDVRCDDCDGAGSREPVSTLDPAYAGVPDFDSYDDYAAWFADDLRDAQLEHERDDCEVA
jgi:RecJ-like exonuclease